MSKHYEDLSGASGRARFFRPARRKAFELFAGAPPRVFFDEQEYALVDLSGAGAGCQVATSEAEELHSLNQRGVLRLVQRGQEIFRGRARQARMDLTLGRAAAGFALEDGLFDFSELQRRNARALAAGLTTEGADALPTETYRAFLADAHYFIGGYLHRIAAHFEPIEKGLREEDISEIIDELDHAASAGWRAILERGNELVLDIHENKRARETYKTYTERTITRDLVKGAGWARSYYKPLGYPGDFQIMNWIYDGTPLGESLAAKFVNHLGAIATRPVKTRMDAIAALIVDAARGADGGRPFEIASVGCGPARELEPILAKSGAGRFRATLIDQETQALEYALSFSRRLAGAERLEVQALNISFKDMLNPSPMTAAYTDKDIIYSAGLVDYLNPLLARRFVRQLYQLAKPGGCVIIGNVNNSKKGTIWSTEYATDWSMMFRSRADMLAMAADATGADATVEADTLDAIYILKLRKPF